MAARLTERRARADELQKELDQASQEDKTQDEANKDIVKQAQGIKTKLSEQPDPEARLRAAESRWDIHPLTRPYWHTPYVK